MISSLDIFGLYVGAIYAFATPFAAYWLCRKYVTIKFRDIGLGFIGFILYRLFNIYLFPFIYIILFYSEQNIEQFIRSKLFSIDILLIILIEGAISEALIVSIKIFIAYFLLRRFSSQTRKSGPALAYAIGFLSFDSFNLGSIEILHAGWATFANESGFAALFGPNFDISDDFFSRTFANGFAFGAQAPVLLLIEIAILKLIWAAIQDKNWKFMGVAVVIGAFWRLPLTLTNSFTSLRPLPATFPRVGVIPPIISGETYMQGVGLVVVLALFSLPFLIRAQPKAFGFLGKSPSGSDKKDGQNRGLLATWLDQNPRGRHVSPD
jgi:uncharacterized membrane protein YhfC